jgi:RES domain-containing protein
VGTRWARELKSLVLAVPSAVIPLELNYLLNPLHADFRRIRVRNPEAFRFDPRLRRR